jgi:hypothetical protein
MEKYYGLPIRDLAIKAALFKEQLPGRARLTKQNLTNSMPARNAQPRSTVFPAYATPSVDTPKGAPYTPLGGHYPPKCSMSWKRPESDSRMEGVVQRFTSL